MLILALPRALHVKECSILLETFLISEDAALIQREQKNLYILSAFRIRYRCLLRMTKKPPRLPSYRVFEIDDEVNDEANDQDIERREDDEALWAEFFY